MSLTIISKSKCKRQIPGLSIALIKKDKVIYKKAYGYSVVEHQVSIKPETVFDLASLSKQFITTAVPLLQQDGKLNIEKSISENTNGRLLWTRDHFSSFQRCWCQKLEEPTSGISDLSNRRVSI